MYIGKKVIPEAEWLAKLQHHREYPFPKPERSPRTEHFYMRKCPDCDLLLEFHGCAGGGAGMAYLIYSCNTCHSFLMYK